MGEVASPLFGAPRGAELRSAPAAASAAPSPRAIGDSLGNLEDWKTPAAIPVASGRSYRQMDFGGQSTAHADHYGMVTQVEEERDPKRLWIFAGMGIGVLIIVSFLMFSGGPEKTAANTNTPGTEQVSALQPPKPPSVWDAKSYVSTSRSNLATPPSKKPEQSDDLFLSDSAAPAKTTAREETNPEPAAPVKQQRQPAQIERRVPAPAPVAQTPASRQHPPASSLPDSTLRKLSTQPAVPERSVEQNRVRQSAAAPPEVREAPPSAPQSGVSGISSAPAPAAESPAPPPAPAPVATNPAPARQQDEAGHQPLRVGGKIKAPQLLHSVPPQYPPMARQAHVEGDVVVDMVIEASGKVGKMNVVSGPLLLRDAATAALRQWEYRPTLLNDQPVPVQMQVLIKFKM